MVESKQSVYDDTSERAPLVSADDHSGEQDAPPLVRAEHVVDPAAHDLLRMVDSTEQHTIGSYQPPVAIPTVEAVAATPENDEDDPETKEEDVEVHKRTLVKGAGIASGIFGCLIGGPILALLLGFGAAYACDKRGAVGDTARAVGELALSTREKAKEIEDKHHVAQRTQVAASSVWKKAKEADGQNRILERTKGLAVDGINATTDFCHRHKLIERGVAGVGKAVYWATDKIATKISDRLGVDDTAAATPPDASPVSEE
jgi:hypothetical protein